MPSTDLYVDAIMQDAVLSVEAVANEAVGIKRIDDRVSVLRYTMVAAVLDVSEYIHCYMVHALLYEGLGGYMFSSRRSTRTTTPKDDRVSVLRYTMVVAVLGVSEYMHCWDCFETGRL